MCVLVHIRLLRIYVHIYVRSTYISNPYTTSYEEVTRNSWLVFFSCQPRVLTTLGNSRWGLRFGPRLLVRQRHPTQLHIRASSAWKLAAACLQSGQ